MMNLQHRSTFKKTSLLAMLSLLPIAVQAQATTNIRTLLNDFLQNWMLPLFLVFLILVFLYKFVQNFELIADKNNTGSTMDGFRNVGWAVLYVAIGQAILAAIVAGAKAMIDNISI